MVEFPKRVSIDASALDNAYGYLGALVTPRPIAWVSTRSVDGVDNLAPHSFYQVVSVAPPIVMVSSMGWKDTANNARDTGEFVVAGIPVALMGEANASAVEFDPSVSEFDAAGVTREPSERVRPFRVAESPYALECKVLKIDEIGNGVVLFGEVVTIAISESIMDGRYVSVTKFDPAARLTSSDWSTLGEIIDLPRYGVEEYSQRYPNGFTR